MTGAVARRLPGHVRRGGHLVRPGDPFGFASGGRCPDGGRPGPQHPAQPDAGQQPDLRLPAGQQPDADQCGRVRTSASLRTTRPTGSTCTPLHGGDRAAVRLRNATVPEPAGRWQAGYTALTLGLLIIDQLANLLAADRRAADGAAAQGIPAHPADRPGRAGRDRAAHGDPVQRHPGRGLRPGAGPTPGHGAARGRHVLDLPGARPGCAQAAVPGPGAGCRCPGGGLVNTVYLVGAVLGGATSVNLANSGPAFQYFYVTTPELAVRPLAAPRVPARASWSTPTNTARFRWPRTGNITSGLMTDVTPETLSGDQTWVYASQANVVDGHAPLRCTTTSWPPTCSRPAS